MEGRHRAVAAAAAVAGVVGVAVAATAVAAWDRQAAAPCVVVVAAAAAWARSAAVAAAAVAAWDRACRASAGGGGTVAAVAPRGTWEEEGPACRSCAETAAAASAGSADGNPSCGAVQAAVEPGRLGNLP